MIYVYEKINKYIFQHIINYTYQNKYPNMHNFLQKNNTNSFSVFFKFLFFSDGVVVPHIYLVF